MSGTAGSPLRLPHDPTGSGPDRLRVPPGPYCAAGTPARRTGVRPPGDGPRARASARQRGAADVASAARRRRRERERARRCCDHGGGASAGWRAAGVVARPWRTYVSALARGASVPDDGRRGTRRRSRQTGRGADRLARLVRDQEVGGSNPLAPTLSRWARVRISGSGPSLFHPAARPISGKLIGDEVSRVFGSQVSCGPSVTGAG